MRTQAALEIIAALRAELDPDVEVTYGEPSLEETRQRHVYLTEIGGTGTRNGYPVVAGGQWIRDDIFTIQLVAQYATPGADRIQASVGAEALWYAVERALYGSGGYQRHIIDAVTEGALLSVEVGETLIGPDPRQFGQEGWMAGFVAELICHGRLSSTR